MVADPRAVADRAADPVLRTLASLTRAITESPWLLTPADLAHARAAGLTDETILQVVLLSSYFGHLNRVADAVGIELDYVIRVTPPHAEAATPPYRRPAVADWPEPSARRALDVAMRPGTTELLSAWREHALHRDAPLDRRQRAVIAHAVAERLGDGAVVRTMKGVPASPQDEALVRLADEVTLAPFGLGAHTVAHLRAPPDLPMMLRCLTRLRTTHRVHHIFTHCGGAGRTGRLSARTAWTSCADCWR